MKNDLDELEKLALKATPGPWSDCNPTCTCGQVSFADGPIAKVESGDWGDTWPAIRLVGDSAFNMKAEAFIEKVAYGHIDPKTARANAAFIAGANPSAVLALIAEIRKLRARKT